MSHECPIPGCTTSVGDHKLMCSRHWYTVPALVQRRVYTAWNGGAGQGTAEHTAASQEAIAYATAAAHPETLTPE